MSTNVMSSPLWSTTFSPHRLVMAVIFSGAIVAGWFLLPGDNERVAMLERDGHSREALAILEHQYAGGDRRYRTLYQMQGLYEDEGNATKARGILEAMAQQRPRDIGLSRKLVMFYRNAQDETAYLAALQSEIELRYSETACRELIAMLRLKGDYAAEQSALQKCRQKGYRRADDLSRLAYLTAADGDTAQAASLLRSIDDLKRLRTTAERYQLLSLLLDQDQPKEAERRALRWIRSGKDDEMAIGLIDLLARSKYPASAIEVAKDAGAPGDSISLTVTERLIEQAQIGPARLYLNGWLDKAKLDDIGTVLRFSDAAIAVGDPAMALKGTRKFGLDRLPALPLQRLAAALIGAGLTDEAAEVRAVALRRPDAAPAGEPEPVAAAAIETPPATIAGTAAGTGLERPPLRRNALNDPLEIWRKSLMYRIADDAQRRVRAQVVGPPPPSTTPLTGRHFERSFHSRGARSEANVSSAKLLKKTLRVLQRTKKNRELNLKRRPLKDRVKAQPLLGEFPQVTTPQGKTPPGAMPKGKGIFELKPLFSPSP